MNKLHNELIEIIIKDLCTYDYSNINKFILVDKKFCEYIKYYLYILNNTIESIYMATKVKIWRAEIDQSDYIYDSFILFDDMNYFNQWDKNTKCIHTSMNREYKEIIKSELYINKNTYEYIYNNICYNIVSEDFYNLEHDTEYNICEIDKLKFDTYFIYYFTEDLIYCYAIHFIILPYYDSRIKDIENYHSYNVVKKNTLCNHNITTVNSIDF